MHAVTPKHQPVQVASITAADAVSASRRLPCRTATSNERDSGTGGGDVPGDIVIDGGNVQLRAERSPSGKGRIYTVTATVIDVAGNSGRLWQHVPPLSNGESGLQTPLLD